MYNAKCNICGTAIFVPETDKEILKQSEQVKKLLEHQKRCEGKFSHLDIDEAFVGLDEVDYHD